MIHLLTYIPDDKQDLRVEEYCTTFIVKSDRTSDEFVFQRANLDEHGEEEGFAVFVDPDQFISSTNSAFLDYNTNLLKFADLIN